MKHLLEPCSKNTSCSKSKSRAVALSPVMVLVALGVVYGDIGTSPMYVMKAIVNGNGGLATMTEDTVIGALSLIIWTMTLITTVKYVLIALRADNKNEGGIFALFSLVKRHGRFLLVFAIVGGAALLADGILTPAVTVTTAIEGLRTISCVDSLLGNSQMPIVVITIVIIVLLFMVQKSGTSSIGRVFGPVMTLWFVFLGVAGVIAITMNPSVLLAINPVYGIEFLFSSTNHAGFMILGSVFLATTGAEALYSDMGHVGKSNIYASWPFVKICLILNYLGQGAWLLANTGNSAMLAINDLNPFFEMLIPGIRPFAVLLSTLAAIIASQALISGSFTLISEAINLDLMPHMRVSYPSKTKGQVFIPLVNSAMGIGCIGVVLLFKSSSNMEAAYGLAITLTMLMTTALMTVYLFKVMNHKIGAIIFFVVFGVIESAFFFSSMTKFIHGGYVTILIAAVLAGIMVIWHRGTIMEHAQAVLLPVSSFKKQIGELKEDTQIPLLADNLAFLSHNPDPNLLERDVLFSILDKHPKRASAYWFINITVTDEPYTHSYSVENMGTNYLFMVQLRLGYKVDQFIGIYLHQIIDDLMSAGELPKQTRRYSSTKVHDIVGSTRFCLLRKFLVPESSVNQRDRTIMSMKYAIRRACGSPVRWYGLETSDVVIEYVPLFGPELQTVKLVREQPREAGDK